MKPSEQYKSFISRIYVPILLVSVVFVLFLPQVALLALRTQGIFWIGIIILLCLPIAKLTLGKPDTVYPFHHWLLNIGGIIIALNLLFYGTSHLLLVSLPVGHTSDTTLIQNTWQNLVWPAGCLPWPVLILMTFALAYVSFLQHKKGILSAVLAPLLGNQPPADAGSIVIDFLARSVLLFMVITLIGTLSLTFFYLFHIFTTAIIFTGAKLDTIIVTMLTLLTCQSQQAQQSIRKLSALGIPSVALAMLMALGIGIMTNIYSLIWQVVISYYPNLLPNFDFIFVFQRYWPIDWQLFSHLWWFGWVPLLSGWIAYLSQGYSFRKIALGLILMTVFSTVVGKLCVLLLIAIQNSWLGSVMILVGASLLLITFIRKTWLRYQMRAIVPGSYPEKPRSLHYYHTRWLPAAAFFFVSYCLAGIWGIYLMSFLIIFPLVILMLIACISIIPLLRKTNNR